MQKKIVLKRESMKENKKEMKNQNTKKKYTNTKG